VRVKDPDYEAKLTGYGKARPWRRKKKKRKTEPELNYAAINTRPNEQLFTVIRASFTKGREGCQALKALLSRIELEGSNQQRGGRKEYKQRHTDKKRKNRPGTTAHIVD